jgi:processive 1,2-diacylglycerol beta-glucosyltransferase
MAAATRYSRRRMVPARRPAARVLILSASAGAGHLRAAEAVEAACRRSHPDDHVLHVDALTLTPVPFRRLYADAYLDLVNRAPELMGFVYDRTNRVPRHKALDVVRLAAERLNTRRFVAFVRDFAPDVVVHTHFLPAEILAHEKKRGRLSVPHAVVVTDFDVHRFWCCPGADRYFVARDDNRVHLAALGQPPDIVQVTGIPIHPAFSAPFDRAALRLKHELPPEVPVVLVLAGGFGVGPIEGLVAALQAQVRDAQLVVVAGRNEALRAKLERAAAGAAAPTRVLGFTREMHEWMAVASLVVSKPGGLTTSEALACGVPLVVANPIPGQETRNATMLYEGGAAISGENPYTIGARVSALLKDPPRLTRMSRAARALGRPRAAFDIVEAVKAGIAVRG